MRFLKPALLVFAVINLLIGMNSGLGRIGWSMPLPELYVHHGAIMVGGFLGSLISLEKVIPLKKNILYAGPAAGVLSILALLNGRFDVAIWLLIFSSAALIVVYLYYLIPHWDFTLIVALAGACCLLTGNIILLQKRMYPTIYTWWFGFLLLTIVSERLELSKFLPVPPLMKNLLKVLLALFLLNLITPYLSWRGNWIMGAIMMAISLWLLRYDMIRIGIRKSELTRFTAVALLCGYVALFVEGWFLLSPPSTLLLYDLVLHTFFIGFVFMMIFAHGPIILPGVLGFSIKPYHPALYLPLVGLILSLKLRITADLGWINYSWRAISGWISAGSILLYFLTMALTTFIALRNAKAA